MDNIRIETEQNIELEYPIASIGERILGWVIDIIIIVIYIFAMFFGLLQAFGGVDYIEDVYIFYILAYLPVLLYHLLFELFFQGRTPGKMLMKTKVAMLDGSRPSVGSYLLRWLLRLIDMPLYGAVAIISFLFSDKGQRLGDRAAGTTVIKLKKMEDLSRKIRVDADPNYVVQFPDVNQLKDEHISIINEVLALPYSAKRNYLANTVASKIKKYLKVESNFPDVKFLQILVKDYYHVFLKEEETN